MKYQVDQELCIGCGMCSALCPDVFEINAEGKAEAVNEGDGDQAVESCPVAAISAAEAEETAENAAEETVEKVETETGVKYVCTVCGYVYDPSVGDPDRGIEPGTPFEELPEDWACPLCGVGKELFNVSE